MQEPTLPRVIRDIGALKDASLVRANAARGDDHSVHLGRLRELAKGLKTQHELAQGLWATGDTDARLLAVLVCRPKAFSAEELDRMLREAGSAKLHDWFVSNVVKRSQHREDLRLRWLSDRDPIVASAGWALTADRVVKAPAGLDLAALLDAIEADMTHASPKLQWAMNDCLAHIGIEHPTYRDRVLEMGERLGVLRNYPTPPGCTSPFVPVWVTQVVNKRGR